MSFWQNINGMRQSKQEVDPHRSPYNHNPSHHIDKARAPDVCMQESPDLPKLEYRYGNFLMHAVSHTHRIQWLRSQDCDNLKQVPLGFLMQLVSENSQSLVIYLFSLPAIRVITCTRLFYQYISLQKWLVVLTTEWLLWLQTIWGAGGWDIYFGTRG